MSWGPAGRREPETLSSSWVILGAHVDSSTLYSKMQVRIPGLELWNGRSGIASSINATPDGMSHTYRVNSVPEEKFAIDSSGMSFALGVGHEFQHAQSTEIAVTTSAYLRILTETPQSLDWFLSQLGKATTLLSFLAGTSMAPDQIRASIASDDRKVDILVALRQGKCCSYANSMDFFMLRARMQVDLGTVLCRWISAYESIETPSQLAQSVLLSDGLWPHVEFLSLLQALEGFHRATDTGLYMEKAAYETIRQTLSNAIPSELNSSHKESLKSRIKYGNEVSLRKRLDALVNRLDRPLRTLVLGGDGTVPRSWVETRNYFTHWDEASKSMALDGLGMYKAMIRMRHLLRALYLQMAGIPQDALVGCVTNTFRESQRLIHLNNAAFRAAHPGKPSTAIMHVEPSDADAGEAGALDAKDESSKD